jgi:predicted amidophosphoribosyltransferase
MTLAISILLVLFMLGGLLIVIRALLDQGRRGSALSCPHCKSNNPAEAKYCARCGTALKT